MASRAARLLILPLVAGALAVGSTAAAAAGLTLWPMYHLDPGHSGNDTSEPSFRGITGAPTWATPALDGAVYAEPLVDGNDVIVATENNSVYAFDASTGVKAWGPTNLGTPRTTNWPCTPPLINPLGITSTPRIDGGYLYVVGEIATSTTTFEFDLAKIDPGTGAVVYQKNITPTGMNTNTVMNRSALSMSAGNVIISWGGQVNDCPTYHGYIETVSESTGVEVAQWSDTSASGDGDGGMWATAGAAVDASGNIFVATGNNNGFATYDYSDSVLKFNSSLVLQSEFVPSQWATWNSGDQDLGSLDPSLLTVNGTPVLFQIGKAGIAYLLNQSSLPSAAGTPPSVIDGYNYSALICDYQPDASFGGLAVSGNTVYVPCYDGITAVTIDSPTHFTKLWHNNQFISGAPPVIAGGLVWSMKLFGGTSLIGFDPASGAVVTTLTLPQANMHFATPSAGDGHLFVGDGTQLLAYAPPPPPPPAFKNLLALDAYGAVHAVPGSAVSSQPALWNFKIGRGIALLPNSNAGYILDGWGGVRSFGGAPPATTTAYWQGWDIARGIALLPNGTGGYVLDGWGGLHAFKVGAGPMPPTINVGAAYWQGWDIARGLVMLPSGSGGYVLDGWGGIHAFGSAPPVGGGPYWQGWDIARSIVLTPAGTGGYVLDGYGGVHQFGNAVYSPGSTYWNGQDIARSIVMQPGQTARGWVLNEAGNIVTFGGAPVVPSPGNSLSFDFRSLATD